MENEGKLKEKRTCQVLCKEKQISCTRWNDIVCGLNHWIPLVLRAPTSSFLGETNMRAHINANTRAHTHTCRTQSGRGTPGIGEGRSECSRAEGTDHLPRPKHNRPLDVTKLMSKKSHNAKTMQCSCRTKIRPIPPPPNYRILLFIIGETII